MASNASPSTVQASTPKAPPVATRPENTFESGEHEVRSKYISVGAEALSDGERICSNVACTD